MNTKEQRNSIGIWWDIKKDGSKLPKVSLDINVWNTIKTHDVDYIEFGIKIDNYSNFKKLNIFLPYQFNLEDVEDKSNCFGSKLFVSALFNEKVTITNGSGSQTTIKREDGKEFCVYKPKIRVKEQILSILPTDIQGVETVYYRIRINKLDNIFTRIKDNNFFLEGLFKDVGFVEFDINIHRRLPEIIADELSKKDFCFESIKFFYMTDTNTNIVYQSLPNNNSRLLEKHIWGDYLTKQNGKDVNKQKIIALFWKKTKEKNKKISDFNLFLKLSFTLRSNLALFVAIITLLILGMVSGLLGNYLTDFIKYMFFDGNENWIQWKTFIWMISIILVILPLTFYLVKKLYNVLKKLKRWSMQFYNCLKGEYKK
ncbi:hypothetical protein [Aliarcobacter butzleri]|uniref:hypothetical protein n=1 Tax=Aliarcobacter butzleri TaxID=28197 RepID=UPI00317989B5